MISRIARALFLVAVVSALGACTTQQNSMYSWGGYSGELLAYYKNASTIDQFGEKLYADIERAETTDNVPPGLYAEYGYLLLQQGDREGAIFYLGKERDTWPESRYLMEKVISRISLPEAEVDETEAETGQ